MKGKHAAKRLAPVTKRFAPVRKAVLAYLLPFLTVLGGGMKDGDLTGPEIVMAVGAGLVTGTAVYRVPNAGDET